MKLVYARNRIAFFFIGFSFLFANDAFADFSGQFAVTNWTISTQAFGCGSSSVNTSGAPASVALSTGTGCSDIGASFTFPSAPSAGTVAFSYTYAVGLNGPAHYPASYVVNGVSTQFSDNAGANSQSGNLTFPVQQGQSFGFVFQAVSSFGQVDSLTISNFSFSAPTNFSVGCGATKDVDLLTAINSAAGNLAANSVTLSPGCVYTESGDIGSTALDGSPTLFQPINNSVTIIGNGATIARDTSTGPARFFYVGAAGSLTLNWLTLKSGIARGDDGGNATSGTMPGAGGLYSGLGGAVLNDGVLVADGVTFDGNQAIGGNGGCSSAFGATAGAGGGLGGAVFSRGSIATTRTLFTANAAIGGNTDRDSCTFVNMGNSGGGGGGAGGVGATGSSIAGTGGYGGGGGGEQQTGGNHGGSGGFSGGGGGSFLSGGAGGEFGGNGDQYGFAGGGGGGLGGAVFVESVASFANIINSTFSGNSALGGGTISGGDGGIGAGGALFVHAGQLTIDYDTLVGNSATGGSVRPVNSANGANATGGGLYVHSGAVSVFAHSIVSNNTVAAGTSSNGSSGTTADADVDGALSSSGYNIVNVRGDSSGYVSSDFADSTAPNLGPLQNNGGPTLTYLPQLGSPAIDADTTVGCNDGLETDQRGDPRPVEPACDIGAVETNDILFRSGFDPPFD